MLTKISKLKYEEVLTDEWERIKLNQKNLGLIKPSEMTKYDYKISFTGSEIEEEKFKREYHLHHNTDISTEKRIDTCESDLDEGNSPNFSSWLIINHCGMFIICWKLLDIQICLAYSWMSMYLAVFTF